MSPRLLRLAHALGLTDLSDDQVERYATTVGHRVAEAVDPDGLRVDFDPEVLGFPPPATLEYRGVTLYYRRLRVERRWGWPPSRWGEYIVVEYRPVPGDRP